MRGLPVDAVEPVVLTRTSYETSLPESDAPENRTIEQQLKNSFININKPKGPTSHQVADIVKRLVRAKKTGHGGTLDPAVTGVLPVAIDEASKVIRTFLLTGKEYVCYMRLHADDVTTTDIKEAFKKFTGTITQMPPVKSAVKRQLRDRKIYYLQLIEHDGRDVLFRVGCEAGTYIRTLCVQLGEHLTCDAHMQQLIRTRSALFDWENVVTLQHLSDAMHFHDEGNDEPLKKMLISPEDAIKHIPSIWMADEAVVTIQHGAALAIPGVIKLENSVTSGNLCALKSMRGRLVALATAQMDADAIMSQKKGIAATVERVLRAD